MTRKTGNSRPGVELAQGETQLLMTSAESAFSFGYTRDDRDHFLVSLADESETATLESSYALDDGYQVFILDIARDQLSVSHNGAAAEHGRGKGLDQLIGRGFVLGADGTCRPRLLRRRPGRSADLRPGADRR